MSDESAGAFTDDQAWDALCCPQCEYSLADAPQRPVCPECGYALGANLMVFRSRRRTSLERAAVLIRCAFLVYVVAYVTSNLIAARFRLLVFLLSSISLVAVALYFRRRRRVLAINDDEVTLFVEGRIRWSCRLADLRHAEYWSFLDAVQLFDREGLAQIQFANLMPRFQWHGRHVAQLITNRAREAREALAGAGGDARSAPQSISAHSER